MLRSALWQWRDDLKWSTRIASSIGSGFGFVLIFLGVVGIIRGGFIVGIWWILIGLFMRNASSMAYRRVLLRDSLEGDKVSRYMKVEPVTVRPEISVRDFIEDYVYKHHYKMFPVVKDNRPVGCVKTENIKSISREEWDEKRVGDIMDECSEKNTISPHADAIESLTKMHSTGESRLLVIERGELVGIITLKDLLRFFSINFDLNRGRK